MIISNCETAYLFLRKHMATLDIEEVWVIVLNSQCRLLAFEPIGRGSLAFCAVSPREIFRFGLLNNGAFMILGHNHPSGDATPSKEDVRWTKNLRRLGLILGLPVVDHLIVTPWEYYSFAKNAKRRLPRTECAL